MSKTATPYMTPAEAEEHIRDLLREVRRMTDRLIAERQRRRETRGVNEEILREIRVHIHDGDLDEIAKTLDAYDALTCPECDKADCPTMLDPDGMCPVEGDICPSCTGPGHAPGWTCPRCGGGGQVYS